MLGGLPESSRYEAQRTAMSDADADVREAALRCGRDHRERELLPEAGELLADPEAGVRRPRRLQAIGELGGETSAAPIADRMTPTQVVRAQAASWVSGEDPEWYSLILAPMSTDEDDLMRAIAVDAMGAPRCSGLRLGGGSARRPEPKGAHVSARSLVASIDPERSVMTLVEMLADGDPDVLSEVATAIGRVGFTALPAVADALDRAETETGALLALGELPQRQGWRAGSAGSPSGRWPSRNRMPGSPPP